MKLHNTIFVLGSIVFLSACDKNETHCPKPKGQCVYSEEQFTSSAPDTGKLTNCGFDPFEVYIQPYDYDYPCFNPNNPDEFSFVRLNTKNGYKGELFTYNLCTQVLTKLADNVAFYSAWSSKNWIAFTDTDHKLYMIKSNGDSLTKILNLPYAMYNPRWNPSGTHLATRVLFSNTYTGVINVDSSSLKQLNVSFGTAFDWLNDTTLIGKVSTPDGGQTVFFRKYYVNTSTQENFFVFDNPEKHINLPQNIQLLVNTSIVAWNSAWNFFKLSLSGSQSLVAKKGSTTRLYVNSSYSSEKVIVARFDREDIPPVMWCKWGLKTNLFIMNHDGTDEKQIVFPE